MSGTEGPDNPSADRGELSGIAKKKVGERIWEVVYQVLMMLPFVVLAAGLAYATAGLISGWLGRIVLAVPGSLFILSAAGITEQQKSAWPDAVRIVVSWIAFIWVLFH